MIEKIKIAIASGKGGTGKTFVSCNLFYSLQQKNKHVTLVDCDAEEPNILMFIDGTLEKATDITQLVPIIDKDKCTFCGKCYEYCSYNAIFFVPDAKIINVMEDLCHGCGACSVACEFDAITEKEASLGKLSQYKVSEKTNLIEARMKVGVHSPVPVIKAAIKAADSEIVLLDSPPGTSCPFIQTVALADYVVLVTEPTPFGLSDLKQSVETLKSIGKPCAVIINRDGLGNNEVADYLKNEHIPLLMKIPFDKNIASSYSKGEILARNEPEWEIKFNNLYNTIIEEYGNSRN